jgi:hypothetical protein
VTCAARTRHYRERIRSGEQYSESKPTIQCCYLKLLPQHGFRRPRRANPRSGGMARGRQRRCRAALSLPRRISLALGAAIRGGPHGCTAGLASDRVRSLRSYKKASSTRPAMTPAPRFSCGEGITYRRYELEAKVVPVELDHVPFISSHMWTSWPGLLKARCLSADVGISPWPLQPSGVATARTTVQGAPSSHATPPPRRPIGSWFALGCCWPTLQKSWRGYVIRRRQSVDEAARLMRNQSRGHGRKPANQEQNATGRPRQPTMLP